MNQQEFGGNISSVQAQWSSRAVSYSIGSCFWLVGYEIGIANHIRCELMEQLLNIVHIL